MSYENREYEPRNSPVQQVMQKYYRRGVWAGFGLTLAAEVIAMIILSSTTKYVVCVGETTLFSLKCLYKFF